MLHLLPFCTALFGLMWIGGGRGGCSVSESLGARTSGQEERQTHHQLMRRNVANLKRLCAR
jgi:hypothetical protein